MDTEQLIKLITAVSDSELTSFSAEEGGLRIKMKKETGIQQVVQTAAPVMEYSVTEGHTEPAKQQNGKVICSPLVGVFYCSESPEAEPFVKKGDTVKKGQVLGIVEAMKLMNEIESEYEGIIEEILVGNEEPVEYGQPLFRMK